MRAEAGYEPPVTAVSAGVNDADGVRDGKALAGASPAMASHLTLYGRGWCHLCDDMKAALIALLAGRNFVLHEVDVDTDPAIEERFGELVPVLLAGTPDQSGEELCHYFLDAGRVLSWLHAFAALTDSRGGAAISGKISG